MNNWEQMLEDGGTVTNEGKLLQATKILEVGYEKLLNYYVEDKWPYDILPDVLEVFLKYGGTKDDLEKYGFTPNISDLDDLNFSFKDKNRLSPYFS